MFFYPSYRRRDIVFANLIRAASKPSDGEVTSIFYRRITGTDIWSWGMMVIQLQRLKLRQGPQPNLPPIAKSPEGALYTNCFAALSSARSPLQIYQNLECTDSIRSGSLDDKAQAARTAMALDLDLDSIPYYAEDELSRTLSLSPTPPKEWCW